MSIFNTGSTVLPTVGSSESGDDWNFASWGAGACDSFNTTSCSVGWNSAAPRTGTYYTKRGHFTGAGLAVPVGSFIKGIEVTIHQAGGYGDAVPYNYEAYLSVDGAIAGSNKSTGAALPDASPWPPDGVSFTDYGAASDVWGLSGVINENVVNKSNFGFITKYREVLSAALSYTNYVNCARVNVHYNPTGMFMAM